MTKRAVVLLSGGLDSATVLAQACADGFECYALSINYGQRHIAELVAASSIVAMLGASEHRVLDIDLTAFGGSSLTDQSISVPTQPASGIPSTYVPARNTIMLSMALAWAEVLQADSIFVGVNAVDYSGYPDCRPVFIQAFEKMANLATKVGVEGNKLTIHAPLIDLSKAEIITLGHSLGVDYAVTISCYQADEEGYACGECDSCRLRRAGFEAAALPDVTRYQSSKI